MKAELADQQDLVASNLMEKAKRVNVVTVFEFGEEHSASLLTRVVGAWSMRWSGVYEIEW